MFKLNRMTDYATAVLAALARRRGKPIYKGQLAELTGLNQSAVEKAAKFFVVADMLDSQRAVCMAAIVCRGRPL